MSTVPWCQLKLSNVMIQGTECFLSYSSLLRSVWAMKLSKTTWSPCTTNSNQRAESIIWLVTELWKLVYAHIYSLSFSGHLNTNFRGVSQILTGSDNNTKQVALSVYQKSISSIINGRKIWTRMKWFLMVVRKKCAFSDHNGINAVWMRYYSYCKNIWCPIIQSCSLLLQQK